MFSKTWLKTAVLWPREVLLCAVLCYSGWGERWSLTEELWSSSSVMSVGDRAGLWTMVEQGSLSVHSAHVETQPRWLHHAVRILPRHSADSLIEHFHFHLQWVFGEIVSVLSPDSWFHVRLLAAIHCNQNHSVRVLPWVALGEYYQRWWDQRLLPAPSSRLYKARLQLDRYPGDPLWALEKISLPGSNSSASKESHPRRLICLCWP